MLDIVRYLAGGTIALIGALVIVCTYVAIFTRGDRSYSLIPFVGPLAVVGGVAITPLPFSHWLWLAFLVDLNSVAIPAFVKVVVESVISPSPSDSE